MPPHETAASQFFNRRRRRRRLQFSGGLSPAVADHVFEGQGTGLTPSPAITAAQVLEPVTFVARVISQQGLGNTVFLTTGDVFGLGFIAGELAMLAPGFGLVSPVDIPFPITSGELTFVMAADPPTNRVSVFLNGILVFDDTDVGFTNWGSAADTYVFGEGTGAIYKSLEIYLNRLASGV